MHECLIKRRPIRISRRGGADTRAAPMDGEMHDCRGPIHARLTSFSSGRDKWKTRDDEPMIQGIKVNFLH